MEGTPYTFWGKLERDRDGRVNRWHPLVDHCVDVAAVVEGLLALPLWRSRLTRLAGQELTPSICARLCVLSVLHDIGKFNLGFQARGCPELGATAGHVEQAIAALFHPIFEPLSVLNDWGDGVGDLLLAALGHHGRPYGIDASASKWNPQLWQSRDGFDPNAGLDDLLSRCRRWYPLAFERDADLLPASASFGHAFAGLVMLADWIGSNPLFFPFRTDIGDDRMSFARVRARDILSDMGLDIPLLSRRDRARRAPFARVVPAHRRPRPAQSALMTLPSEPAGSIALLEAETGSGKTEAALAHFVKLFDAGFVDGLFFALPTRSAATQMQRRVLEAVRLALAPAPTVTLAVPGYYRVDDLDGEKGTQFDVLWPETDDPRWRSRTWAVENSKRFLTGSIVVGTIDQVLLSTLLVDHAHLRATSLLRHLLVVDEVHASDAYMGRVLEHVLQRHLSAGGHALLLSATLGGEMRTRLLSPGLRTSTLRLSEAEATPYPLISYRGSDRRAVAVGGETVERAISIAAVRMQEDFAALAREVLTAALRGAKVLVLRNTVAGCLATQMAVEGEAVARGCGHLLFRCQGLAAPHHSRFAAADRTALDQALEHHLGPNRSEGGCIVVATQTAQQSLDIDADVLYTDLCPADVLLQRIGRLHRHLRRRPGGFEGPHVYVLVPLTRDLSAFIQESGEARGPHGIGTVYDDLRILESTWRLIEAHTLWRIPAMNRLLVERSLHSSVQSDLVAQGGPRWQAHAMALMGRQRGHARLADLNVIDWKRPYADTPFPTNGEHRIVTRLGEDDRRVRFRDALTSPFGNKVTELTLKPYWISPVDAIDEFAETTDNRDAMTFSYGGKQFLYDRLGLRPLAPGVKDVDPDDGP